MATPKTPKAPAKKPAVAKAPAAKAEKPAATKAPAKRAAAPKKKSATAPNDPPNIAPEQRRNYVEVAAYFIAERHGFTPGRELQDWAAAEAEIDRLLAAGLISSS